MELVHALLPILSTNTQLQLGLGYIYIYIELPGAQYTAILPARRV